MLTAVEMLISAVSIDSSWQVPCIMPVDSVTMCYACWQCYCVLRLLTVLQYVVSVTVLQCVVSVDSVTACCVYWLCYCVVTVDNITMCYIC